MNTKTKDYVVNMLESCQDRAKKIALLRYELEHPARVSPEEVIDAMSFGHGDGIGGGKGHISNKTLYIALNYLDRMDSANKSAVEDIVLRLRELEQEQDKLLYYISLLEPKLKEVIDLLYLKGEPFEKAEKDLEISSKTLRKLRNSAVDALAAMYEFVGEK